MDLQLLPPKIESIQIYANGVELGVLTQASIHHFQPIQTQQYVSLTMTRAISF
jgi:serine/threonine-protein kinase HipA